jgi:hypothetical protein
MNLHALFSKPPTEYRSAPFWSWNDKLDPKEVIWQIKEMKKQGMGGFFMHSREGLETEYLGSEWMECIHAAVSTAREEGMGAWLYDEDRFPSGAAGSLVTSLGDAYRSKALTFEVSDSLPKTPEILIAFIGKVEGNRLLELRAATGNLAPDEVFLIFRQEIAKASAWYNNEAPVDNLNPEAVRAFIKSTHEAYRAEVGEEFGKVVPGIFTDEPNILHGNYPQRRYLPWTYNFADYFQQKRGYELLQVLPYLFLDGSHSTKTRHDFWHTITERFVSAFSQQLGEWCAEQKLVLTGHYLDESDLGTATRFAGAIMPHYPHMQMPGIDILYEQTDEYITIKQCTSIANQLSKKRVLSEMYGCSGWEFSFEGQKWVGDWQYVQGINFRCQHLALYSLRGCRKRDYPPSFNYNNSWWQEYKVLEDYFARLGAVLSQGRPIRELLVLHPQTTAWAKLGDNNCEEVTAIGDRLNTLAKELLVHQYDFDFGDELVMAEHGRIQGKDFFVGEAGYKLLLIPFANTILPSTKELIAEFIHADGKVIIYGDKPTQVAAEEDSKLDFLWQEENVIAAQSQEELFAALDQLLGQRIRMKTELGLPPSSILAMERQLEEQLVYFFVNIDKKREVKTQITLPYSGKLEEWDPLTGEIRPVIVQEEANSMRFKAKFGPAGSKLYVVSINERPKQALHPIFELKEKKELGPLWQHMRTCPNIFLLDQCAWRLEGEAWSEVLPLWRAQYALREKLGMRQIHMNAIEQRYLWVDDVHPKDGTKLELAFSFHVEEVPENLELILEQAEFFEVYLNGISGGELQGWFLDKAMKRVKLPKAKLGANQLILRCEYYHWMELEDCFLAGDFAVLPTSYSLTKEPNALRSGDWCLQGYPFYPGSMRYLANYHHFQDERVFLDLEAKAITTLIEVNSKTAGKIPWRAASPLELTNFLTEGDNQLVIEVFASPRNMLGPLHRNARQGMKTGHWSFRTEGDAWNDEYVLWPWGLEAVKILVK